MCPATVHPDRPESKAPCAFCAPLADEIGKLAADPRRQYARALQTARALEQQGAVELLAGDCPLAETDAVLAAEEHYTVCHYLRCRRCGAVYFLGACVRGQPIGWRVEDLTQEKLLPRLWGRCGSWFSRGGA